MITSVSFNNKSNPDSELLRIGLVPDESANPNFMITNVDGVGPIKVELYTYSGAGSDGDFYQGHSRGPRNLVFTIEYAPGSWLGGNTGAELRSFLYQWLMPGNKISMKFFTDHLGDLTIDGVIESLEPNIFTQVPSLQMSVHCPDPDFLRQTHTISGTGQSTNPDGTPGEPPAYFVNYQGSSQSSIILTVTPSIGQNKVAAVQSFTNYPEWPLDGNLDLQYINYQWISPVKINSSTGKITAEYLKYGQKFVVDSNPRTIEMYRLTSEPSGPETKIREFRGMNYGFYPTVLRPKTTTKLQFVIQQMDWNDPDWIGPGDIPLSISWTDRFGAL